MALFCIKQKINLHSRVCRNSCRRWAAPPGTFISENVKQSYEYMTTTRHLFFEISVKVELYKMQGRKIEKHMSQINKRQNRTIENHSNVRRLSRKIKPCYLSTCRHNNTIISSKVPNLQLQHYQIPQFSHKTSPEHYAAHLCALCFTLQWVSRATEE
jgi:hypothetical protein